MSTYGAMEHQTMTTLGNYIINGALTYETTIAHELCHQWYGNAVSFLTFKDVWLSEGFATYSEHLWKDKTEGWESACNYIRTEFHNYYLNWENIEGPQTIYNPSFNSYFAPPSYEKAASVLHMLRLKIGNANFFS
jgi:aminopeptidase N